MPRGKDSASIPPRWLIDKDRVKGTIDELLGSAKQKAGEQTGDTQLEVEGIAQHVKGNLENAWGKAKVSRP
jgi:uncharacterized protein YjbJ (UPF0337 family)